MKAPAKAANILISTTLNNANYRLSDDRPIGVVFVEGAPMAYIDPRHGEGGERRITSGTKNAKQLTIRIPPVTHTLVLTAGVDEMLTILDAFRPGDLEAASGLPATRPAPRPATSPAPP